MKSLVWQQKIKEMIPSHGESLAKDPALHDRVRSWTRDVLRLEHDLGLPV
jgi:malate dehydrogenase (quinone)